MSKFVVYALCTGDRGVFYIGQGQSSRPKAHVKESRKGCVCHKCNVIRKAYQTGDDYDYIILSITADHQRALDLERAYIAVYGRDNLTNKTDGGEGNIGWTPDEVTIARMKIAAKERLTPEVRQKISSALKGNVISPEQRAKQSASMMGRLKSEETKARMSAAAKRRSKEHYANATAYWTGRKLTDEEKLKISIRTKERMADPIVRQRMSDGRKKTREIRSVQVFSDGI